MHFDAKRAAAGVQYFFVRKGIAIGILAALAACAAAWYYLAGGSNGKPPQYRTARVERGELSETVTATGTIGAVTTVQVGTQVSGTIREIYVDYNSPVKAGQPVARIDPQLFEAAVTQARGNLESARAALAAARVKEASAERTLARTLELSKRGYVSQAEADDARTAFDAARAQVQVSEALVSQAEGAFSVAETNLRLATIRSPVDGIVISRNVDVGQTVAASFQTPTLFTIAEDLSRMQIDTAVDEADIGKVRRGQESTFTVDAYPGRVFSGEVVQVRNAPVVTQNVVTYNVVVRVDNRELLLKPGMTATVSLHIRTEKDVVRIPNAALRYRPPDEEDPAPGKAPDRRSARVYRVGPKGKPVPVPVKTGFGDESFTKLEEGGLTEGDELIVGEAGKRTNRAGGGAPFGLPGMRR